jgi:hypothetical protein
MKSISIINILFSGNKANSAPALKSFSIPVMRSYYVRRINHNGFTTSFHIPLTILCIFLWNSIYSQAVLSGRVFEKSEQQIPMPLTGANVHWLKTSVAVSTDEKGRFSIPVPGKWPQHLVASFVGYQPDTIQVENADELSVFLYPNIELKSVEIHGKRDAVGISTLKPVNTEVITEKELLKAACCNLSEAFETSPTVSVAYKDAVTGAKEIRMLGLGGIYSQIMTENIPSVRGIGGIYGLTFIPGPWMESIQISKGSGSVLNGYESTTGQINIEFLKPQSESTPDFYLNLFREMNGNSEINTHFKKVLDDKWSSILMLHGNYLGAELDHNKDDFKDMPSGRQFNLYNRWQYHSGNRIESQFGLKLMTDLREGGQVKSATPTGPTGEIYRTEVENKRAEVFAKLGVIYPDKPFKSIGNIVDFTVHDLTSSFGLKTFNASQRSLFVQSIYQNSFSKTNHQYKVGFTYRHEATNQLYILNESLTIENVPGVFAEYIYNYIDKLTLILGVREDYHNKYDWIFTPRFHGKYNFSENLVARLSAGRSFRVPFVLADNISVMSSSKELLIREEILPERAWNYGVNATWKFLALGREASLSGDFYRTDFTDQLIVDMYSDSASILFYNLDGSSYSNSFQVTLNYELLHGTDIRIAYKMEDVKSTYSGILQAKPLVSQNKALMNISYTSGNEHWKFSYTLIWDDRKKLPLATHHSDHAIPERYSPDFFIMHAQVTKVFRRFELYAGAENLLDYTQHDPVIGADNPFSNDFDASRIWGPLDGRRIYAGLRMSIR